MRATKARRLQSSRKSRQRRPILCLRPSPPSRRCNSPIGRCISKRRPASIRLSNAETGAPLADVAYVYFQLEGTDPAKRPVTFAINGGPGAGSAWLDLGGLGPWRIPLTGAGRSAAANPVPTPNADTWLDFTDLVFIDPRGHGLQPDSQQRCRREEEFLFRRRRHQHALCRHSQMDR